MDNRKQPLFSVTIKDCEVQTFTVGGHGGSGKDTSNSGCRVVHRGSGATGRATESRSLTQNRRTAFIRMANTSKFMNWAKLEAAKRQGKSSIKQVVDTMLSSENLKIEVQDEKGRWVECLS